MSHQIIVYKNNAGAPLVANTLKEKFDLKINHFFHHTLRGCAAQLSADEKRSILLHPDVEKIIEDYEISLGEMAVVQHDGKQSDVPWGIRDVLPSTMFEIQDKNKTNVQVDQDVYIVDSGVDELHPDLNVVEHVSFIPDSIFSFDKRKVHGHATHVAGIIGGTTNALNSVRGVAPGIRIHSLRVLDGAGKGILSSILAAIEFLINRRMDMLSESGVDEENIVQPMLVNMSLGFDTKTGETTELDVAIEKAALYGIIFVVAGGNASRNSKLTSPAHCPNVISVSAYNNRGVFSSFSNFGKSIRACAPGTDILSTWPSASYATMSGTSMAAPHITGIIAYALAQSTSLMDFDKIIVFLQSIQQKRKIISTPADTISVPICLPQDMLYSKKFLLLASSKYVSASISY